jgi:prophage antirepressor-like protein
MVVHKAGATGVLACLFEGRQSRLALLSESGFYRMVNRSDMPEAEPFQDWVTREVLPSIRKTLGNVAGAEEGRIGWHLRCP